LPITLYEISNIIVTKNFFCGKIKGYERTDKMRALIFSDSHGSIKSMTDIIDREKNIDLIIHAGDVCADVEALKELYPDKKIEFVRGNNDYMELSVPTERLFTFGGKKVFLTHGHKYGVKVNPYKVYAAAREALADICIFGHTHSRYLECVDGIWLFNSGSSRSSCGLLDVSNGEIKLLFLY